MLDFLLLVFLIVLMISLYALLVAHRGRSRSEKQVYYTAENTGADSAGDDPA